jgi:protein-disulfide isomerase
VSDVKEDPEARDRDPEADGRSPEGDDPDDEGEPTRGEPEGDETAAHHDDEADSGAHPTATAGPKTETAKPKSALGSVLGILGFVAALGGGFFVGQWIRSDGDASAQPEDVRRFKVNLRGDEPQKGPDDALVTIVEFADYQCPYCEKAMGPLEEVLEDYEGDVRLVYKHFPLQMHPAAGPAARAAWAAQQQGKFWEMHRFLFEQKASLSNLETKARELGLDLGKLQADLASKEASAAVDDDFKAGGMVGVTGTPHFFVNGHRFKGALDEGRWKAILDEELEAAREVEKQVGRAGVYAKLMEGAIERAASDAAQAPRREGEPDPAVAYQVPTGEGRPALGPEDALVTVVVFSDFQCPFCARLGPTVHDLAEKHGARVVFRQMPLSMHPQARDAAKASLAAHRQGKFWEMHDVLFAKQREIQGEAGSGFRTFAEEIGLDVDQFASDMADPAIEQMVAEDEALARRLGVSGTPASFVNGRFVRGAADDATFGPLIEAQKAEAQALVDAGTPAAGVYDALMQKAVPHPGGKSGT